MSCAVAQYPVRESLQGDQPILLFPRPVLFRRAANQKQPILAGYAKKEACWPHDP